jgi:hypothetical protein
MSALDKLAELAHGKSEVEDTITQVAPSAVILASTVEKARNGDSFTTSELSPLVKRLAFSELSSAEIADRFTKAFGDVLFSKD